MKTLFFPFGKGLHEENDDRLQLPGAPSEILNLIATKNGRLETRKDYDALPMDNDQGTEMTVFDIHEFLGRLIGFADIEALVTPASPTDIVEYVAQPTGAWRGTSSQRSGSILADRGPRLGLVTDVRDVLSPAYERDVSNFYDVAAGGGRVCIAWKDAILQRNFVQVVDAATRATLLIESFTLNEDMIRVVCVSGVFFLATVMSGAQIALYRFNPASDDHFVVVDFAAAPAGTDVLAMDLAVSHEGNTFWMVVARAAGFRVYGYNSSGTETHDFAGAAVSASAVTVLAESVTSSTLRIHVACSITSTTVVDLYTYTTAGALQTGTANILADTSTRQVGLVMKDPTEGQLMMFTQDGDDVDFTHVTNSTHAVGNGRTWFNAFLSTKPAMVRGRMFVGLTLDEGDDQFSNLMACPELKFSVAVTPVSSTPGVLLDSATASDTSVPFMLPTLATDADTGKSYWAKLRTNALGKFTLSLTELQFCGTARRQMAILGDIAYIAGGLPQAFDGQQLAETCFLHRPRIVSSSQNSSGSKTQLGTYQTVYIYECSDANRNRIQGPPSAVLETTFTASNDRVDAVVSTSISMHNRHSSSVVKGVSSVAGYSTLNTADGNLTFHREQVRAVTYGDDMGESVTINHSLSDEALGDEEILYTQGARGALSGPLAFEAMQPCTSLATSADRVLSCGLPNRASIQESRPLLVGEQVYWSNSIGFQRQARGEVLAVARLDERRIAFSSSELFELDGPGVDDNGNGDIGAPRRLPSDVGLYGGALGWCSIVEFNGGLMFRGLINQIYILPRGSVTPVPAGQAVEDTLSLYPNLTSATYLPEDQEVRFTCNNAGNTDGVVLVYAVRFGEWFVEGPFGEAITSGTRFQGRFCMLRNSVVYQQRATRTYAAFIPVAWRSGVLHPFKPGQQGRVYAIHFVGGFEGNCQLTFRVRFNELRDGEEEETETVEVFDMEAGQEFSYRFEANQMKCESLEVDFETSALQGSATAGLAFNYWLLEIDSADTAALRAPLQMS